MSSSILLGYFMFGPGQEASIYSRAAPLLMSDAVGPPLLVLDDNIADVDE